MKKFGVYVKFSNAEEFKELGGYFENNDNVIARTPSKNSANLESLKQAILELVNPNKVVINYNPNDNDNVIIIIINVKN